MEETKHVFTDREITLMDKQLKDLRCAMDALVKLLDYKMTEQRRWQITEEAQILWEEIKEIKRM